MNFNYEITNEKFKNNKVCEVIFKFSILYFKNNDGIDSNSNLKIFNLPMKSSFSNMALTNMD